MRKHVLCTGLAWCIALLFMAKVGAQPHSANLHTTVTHESDGAAITRNNRAPTAQTKPQAEETIMPQKKSYDYMGAAKYVQSAVNNTLYNISKDGIDTKLPADFHYNMAQWTQHDVTEFAKGYYTFDTYEILLGIANTCFEKDKNGKLTDDALNARAALEAVKPDGCNSWVGFGKMVMKAADESQTTRNEYRKAIEARKNGKGHGSIIDPKEFSNIAVVTDDKVQTIDPKAAFKAAGGIMSSEQAKFDEMANAALAKLKAEQGLTRAA